MFRGTRVPALAVFHYVEGGETLEEFLREFTSVSREQATAALEAGREAIAEIERSRDSRDQKPE